MPLYNTSSFDGNFKTAVMIYVYALNSAFNMTYHITVYNDLNFLHPDFVMETFEYICQMTV